MPTDKKVTLSFAEISERLRRFPFPEVDAIVGIETGGQVPAALVAMLLGKPLFMFPINYRDEENQPRYEHPEILNDHYGLPPQDSLVLLVDDVSVSGVTLKTAAGLLGGREVLTFTLKGRADFVLFPEIENCVHWPWRS